MMSPLSSGIAGNEERSPNSSDLELSVKRITFQVEQAGSASSVH